MKKNQIVSLIMGSAFLVAGAAAYTAAKFAGKRGLSEPEAVPEDLPEEEREAAVEEPEAEEPVEEAPEEVEELAEEAASEEVEEPAEAAPVQAEETAEEPVEPAEEAAPEEAVEEPAEESAADVQAETQDELTAETQADDAKDEQAEQKPANLEEYIELNPEERENLESVKDSFAAEGVRTDISFMDNTMFFDFVMEDVEDEETREILKPDLAQFLDDQEEAYKGLVKQIEEDTGFGDIKMIVIFMDENGEEIVSGHYDESGRTM